MEMTTRTQLQTHFSRLLDLASQPSPPLKPTFWDKLDLDCRQASVDQARSWKFNNESAWDPIALVKDEWNKSIYPGAIKPLLQDNTRMVYKNVKRQTPYSVCCWMIGREWHSSRPAAIIICGNKRVTKNAVKLIEGHGELSRTWGFRVYGYESKISITMGTSRNENDDDDDSPLCAISGTRFAVGGRDFISTQMATLGGSIEIDGEFFGVTVAHPFLGRPQDESSDDDESDMSDDDSEVTELISHTEEAPYITLETDAAFVEEPRSHRRKMLGAIPDSNRPRYFSHGADWALLKLRPADLPINLITGGDKLVVPWWITRDSLSEGELWAAVSPVNPVQTKASPSTCGLFIPNVGLQDVWALNMKAIPGYCGSWVVDVSSGGLSGIIVAGSESNDVSYALPAHVVFDEIRARFPSMQLQSLERIAELYVPGFVEIIYRAAELGLTRFVTEVVSKRSPLNNQDSSGYNPLCWAIKKGYGAAVASLLEAGASPHSVGTNSGRMPLALATDTGHTAIVKLVLSAGANPDSRSGHDGSTPLMSAVKRGHREIAHLLIASGASVNSCNVAGSTPLVEAARHGDEEVISILIDGGADINKKSPLHGRTPLMEAVLRKNENAVRVLLEKGADVDCVDDSGNRPLLSAAEFDNPAILKLLIERGADINKKGLRGHTPLMKAILSCRETSARVLLENGADVDCVDDDGNTPLLLAAGSKYSSIVKLLIERGAWVDTRNNDGDTALILAAKIYTSPGSFRATIGCDEIFSTLLEHGANPDSQDAQDNTALSLAIAGGMDSTVRILLDYHASMDIPNSLGQTPHSLAKQNENIARVLSVDEASLVETHGKLPPVCPPAPSNSPVIRPLREPLPSESGPMSESAEERRQKEKRKFGESLRDVDESMAELGVEYRRTYRRT